MTRWFDSIEEAERYKSFLYENFFFDLELVCDNNNIVIKEFFIPKMWRI